MSTASPRARHRALLPAWLCLLVGLMPALAVAETTDPERMPPRELILARGEIERMRQTSVSDVEAFEPAPGTAARIERLFASPELRLLTTSERSNALIFAGRETSLLSFDGSDQLLDKIRRWFPNELASASLVGKELNRYGFDLWGPFNDWSIEPAAFLSLWKCMPEHAWMHPEESPFLLDGDLWQHTDVSRPFDYSDCLTQTSDSQRAPSREWAPEVRAHLLGVFDRQLTRSSCRGSGPADCVLLLYFWSELDATDPRLAAQLHRLGAAIADRSASNREHDATDAATVLREAAWLRAELRSMLAAPKAWMDDTPGLLLSRMQALRQGHSDLPRILGRNAMLDPWRVLKEHRWLLTGFEADIYAQMDELLAVDACAQFRRWFDYLPPAAAFRYLLHSLEYSDDAVLACSTPDWHWLRTRDAVDTEGVQPALWAHLSNTANTQLRDRIMSALLGDGEYCFASGEGPVTLADWLHEWCGRWVHEPVTVPAMLPNTALQLDQRQQFQRLHAVTATSPRAGDDSGQSAALERLLQGMPEAAQRRFRDYTQSMHEASQSIQEVEVWRHPAHSRALLILTLSDDAMGRRYLSLSPDELRTFSIPDRFRYGTRNGSRFELEIMRVSDLDADGDLEIWHGPGDLDRCHGDDGDLQLGLDCSATSPELQMGEIDGDLLTWFTDDRGQNASAGEQWRTDDGLAYPLPTLPEGRDWRPWDQRCNHVLVASWLADHGVSADAIVDLVCARHPTRADQAIVALFMREPLGSEADGVDAFRRIVAVVDVQEGKPVRLQSRIIEADASMRIDSHTLSLDFGDYALAPGLRAFGVRMNIGYSPRYAEGGESGYFGLFVEEGSQLGEVLVNFALSDWHISDGSTCWDQSGEEDTCIVESRERRLVVADTEHQGRRDLRILTTVNRRNNYAADEGQYSQEQETGTLQYADGAYRLEQD